MQGKFYSVLLSLFIIPFFIGGIVGGFKLSLAIQHSGIFGISSANPWALLIMNVGMAVIGIYISGILSYAVFLLLAVALFSRKQIEDFFAKLPQDEEYKPNFLLVPFQAVSKFFMARAR